MKPIVSALQLRLEKLAIVPAIDWQARQEKWITARSRGSKNRGDPVLVTAPRKCVFQSARKLAVHFRKCVRIGKRPNRSADPIFNHLLRGSDLLFDLAELQRP